MTRNALFDNYHFTGALMACLLPICFCELDYTLSRKEFPLEQYNYLVTVWCIFSCDSSAAYCS